MKGRRASWMLSFGLVLLCSCKAELEDNASSSADPLDDAWIDAIETGEEELVAAHPSPEPTPSELGPQREPAAPTGGPATVGGPAAAPVASLPRPWAKPAPAGASTEPVPEPAAEPDVEPGEVGESSVEPGPVAEAPTPAAVEPAAPASPPPITIADFHGSFRFVGGQTQRDGVTAAVEKTVQSLSSALRGIARRRLTAANPVDTKLDIGVSGDKVTTTFKTGFSVACVVGGSAVRTKGREGERLDVQVRMKGSKLVQHMQGKGGARTIVYVLSADRKKLTVHHKITSPRLPVPVVYRLTYSR